MRHLVLALVLLGGCSLYPFDGDGDDVCDQPYDLAQPAPERLINPETLVCEEFSYGYPCNSECGPCPGSAEYIPPWGRCESECTGLAEAQCIDAPTCRIARSETEYYTGQPSFQGCYQTSDPFSGDAFVAPCETLDAEGCARDAACTGLYDLSDCGPTEDCARTAFRGCIDEAQIAGTCDAPVSCRSLPPSCPANTTPGVASGCWTGSCIPNALCSYQGGS
jgi:hypothetical protein